MHSDFSGLVKALKGSETIRGLKEVQYRKRGTAAYKSKMLAAILCQVTENSCPPFGVFDIYGHICILQYSS
jgi:hypothetical protein